jgi:hypothetical protein
MFKLGEMFAEDEMRAAEGDLVYGERRSQPPGGPGVKTLRDPIGSRKSMNHAGHRAVTVASGGGLVSAASLL